MPATRTKPRARRAAISDDLREIIARRGPAYALGQEAGVAPSILTRFLAHERTMSLETLDRLAEVLGLRLVATGRRAGPRARQARPAPAETPIDPTDGDDAA